MTQANSAHQVDVSIRAHILRAAQARLEQVREAERVQDGVAHTTMADVARYSLRTWDPKTTTPAEDEDGTPRDPAGTRITVRGHRKFDRGEKFIPDRTERDSDHGRVLAVGKVIDQAVLIGGTAGLTMLNEARRTMTRERLNSYEHGDATLYKHWQQARRELLPPLRFTMAEDAYQQIVARLTAHNTTLTRCLEVGLSTFARTGNLED